MLVGHLLGGLVARLYAGQYPDEVAGMVFVDHAFHPAFPSVAKVLPPATPPMTLAPGGERRHARYRLAVPLQPVPPVTLNERGELAEK